MQTSSGRSLSKQRRATIQNVLAVAKQVEADLIVHQRVEMLIVKS